jgi:hypothetical protein
VARKAQDGAFNAKGEGGIDFSRQNQSQKHDMVLHRAIKSTMLYINIENAIYSQGNLEEFHVKVAHNLYEACGLLEVDFEYVTDVDGAKLFRKRK